MKKKDASVSTYGIIISQNMKNPTVEILIAIQIQSMVNKTQYD